MKVRVCALGALVLGAGCSTGSSANPVSNASANLAPRVPDMSPMDGDRNRIDDSIDRELAIASDDATVKVEAVFKAQPPTSAVSDFEAAGGTVRRVLHGIGYGFTGRIPRRAIAALVPKLGSDLLLIKQEQVVVPHLDESTHTSRARAVWAPGFAGSTNGFNGSPKVNIAFVDGGIDSTHPDLKGRLVGYKDYTSEAVAEPKDMLGHGTHVAGIALGSGTTFGTGPGTLSLTEWGTAAELGANDWQSAAYHLPANYTISGTVTFEGTATTLSFLKADDGKSVYSSQYTSAAQTSPLSFTYNGTGLPAAHYTLGLRQNAAKSVKRFAIAAKITNYPAVGDGFPALRGIAPESGYYAAKIFPVSAQSETDDITDALQDIYDLRESLDLKVVNCSFGIIGGGTDPAQRAKVASLVDHGVVVVASSGNNGGSGSTGDPGRTAQAITVGAANDVNQLTSYSSGSAKTAADTDDKPDVLAPGGSTYRSKVISVDSNWNDSATSTFADAQPNDYQSNMGTSMAAPVVSGAAALVIQALESKGHVWDYNSNKSSSLVKMLLLATATETNQDREANGNGPTLGRAATPKDIREGYGHVNIDAAIEAASLTWDLKEPLTGSTNGGPGDRRAWARKIKVPKGEMLRLALAVPTSADFDVYVYTSTPSEQGSPVLQSWGAKAGLGVNELTTWTFLEEAELYVVVKRIAGTGGFILTGSTFVSDGGVFPEGVIDGGADDDAGDTDAGTAEAGSSDAGPPVIIEPEPTPDPAPTPAPTTAPTNTFTPSATVERLEPGGGGCALSSSSSGSTLGFGSLGLALMTGLLVRRRRRS